VCKNDLKLINDFLEIKIWKFYIGVSKIFFFSLPIFFLSTITLNSLFQKDIVVRVYFLFFKRMELEEYDPNHCCLKLKSLCCNNRE